MENIASKLCDELLKNHHTDPETLSQPPKSLESVLQFDIISIEGKIFEIFSKSEELLRIQFHVLYNKQISRSQIYSISDFSKPFSVAFSSSFNDRPNLQLIHSTSENRPITIYITTIPLEIPGFVNSLGLDRQKSSLFAQAVLDSRLSHIFSGDFFSVELASCQTEYVFSAEDASGIMFVRMVRTGGSKDQQFISPSESDIALAESSIQQYQTYLARLSHENFLQIRSWWGLLKQHYPHLTTRTIKLMAEDECGRHRFICNFVSPVFPNRELLGPRFAARFVSLIPLKRESSLLSGGRICRWLPPHAFLSTLQGDVESHAILLCSLLLGWGLNAYVASGCIFSSERGQSPISMEGKEGSPPAELIPVQQVHYWVVSIEESSHEVTFWESLTGEQLKIAWSPIEVELNSPRSVSSSPVEGAGLPLGSSEHHYREIWTLFKHDCLFVNIQSDCGPGTSFDLKNPRCWQRFPPSSSGQDGSGSALGTESLPFNSSLSALRHPGAELVLSDCRTALECQDLEIQIERGIKDWIVQSRVDNGLQTLFDESLSILLHPALVSYELDRAAGFLLKNSDFASSVQQCVRPGQCFKAFPTCFSHTHLPTMFSSLLRNPAAKSIIFARSSIQPSPSSLSTRVAISPLPTRLGVRVRIVPYPERLCAVWVAIAACYDGE